jgi:hypothetical protein
MKQESKNSYTQVLVRVNQGSNDRYYDGTTLSSGEMYGGKIGLYSADYIDVYIKQGTVYNPMKDALPFRLTFERTTY